MKKKFNLLFAAMITLISVTACGKEEIITSTENEKEKLVETVIDGEKYIQIPDLPEHKEYQLSITEYNRLNAADGLISLGESDAEPILYIGQYTGLEDMQSVYEPETFLRGMVDSYIFETKDSRMEIYLVPEKYVSDYICITKTAIESYLETREGLDEMTKSFMQNLADGIRIDSRETTFDADKTSGYILDNSKIFYEYVETDYDNDGITEKSYPVSLCTCTALKNDLYLIIRNTKAQQTDPLYNSIVGRFVPDKQILEIYTEKTDIFKENDFEEWMKLGFPYETTEQLHSAEMQINNFALRIIPFEIHNVSEQELNAAKEAHKVYYKEKFSD